MKNTSSKGVMNFYGNPTQKLEENQKNRPISNLYGHRGGGGSIGSDLTCGVFDKYKHATSAGRV